MFRRTAELYDVLYSVKDYAAEAARLRAIVHAHERRPSRTLLDVGCATGNHLTLLRDGFEVEGLDLDGNLLAVARKRHPGIRFTEADMSDFDLGRRFDVVTCLYGSIAYTRQTGRFRSAVLCMARHTAPGGLVVIEPWHLQESYAPTVQVRHVDGPDLKIARMSSATVMGGVAILEVHYLAGDAGGIQYLTERHELGLFRHDEHVWALQEAGLEVHHEKAGITDRGLYIGVAPSR